MASWSKTLHGKDIATGRAFLPLQHAMVRLGYELTEVREGARLKFKRRTESALAWDNHRREHTATLRFKQKTRGVFTKEQYLEVEVTFDDWDMTVSEGAAKAWQETADKLQVMLSDPATFLPLVPPSSFQALWDHGQAVEPAYAPGTKVWVLWNDGCRYPARVEWASASTATVALRDGRTFHAAVSSLAPRLEEEPRGVTIREHTIERQVVVVRCKYCGTLTPVELEKCSGCGAGKFC